MTCPVCSMPLVWSVDREQMWCSVWGTHPALLAGLLELVMAAPDHSRRGVHNRRREIRRAERAERLAA